MIFTTGNLLFITSIILLISILVTKMGSRLGVPTLLVFLLVGMFFGSDGLGFEFNNTALTQFIGMIALSIILFSGGMDTKVEEIKPILWPGVLLSTAGVVLTTLFTGLFIYFISKSILISIAVSFPFALLTAATMSSTDSASVFNILRSQRIGLKNQLRPMLELESGSNDPMAYMLTIVLIGLLGTNQETAFSILLRFLMQFSVGCVSGYLLGRLAILLINKINLQNTSLYPILILPTIFIIFSLTDTLGGNGYLAVYIAGIVVGNKPLVKKREISTFLDGMTWLFQIIMFLMLGLLVNPSEMLSIAPFALLIGIFMILVGRPLSVFLSLLPFRSINFCSKVFISWVGLRGAAPILFATYPIIAHVEGAHLIFNIVFFITIISLLVQGMSITWLSKKLNLTAPYSNDSNTFGITIPEEIGSNIWEMDVTDQMTVTGKQLKHIKLGDNILIIYIKRGHQYIIPNGSTEIQAGDKLLLISHPETDANGKLPKQP